MLIMCEDHSRSTRIQKQPSTSQTMSRQYQAAPAYSPNTYSRPDSASLYSDCQSPWESIEAEEKRQEDKGIPYLDMGPPIDDQPLHSLSLNGSTIYTERREHFTQTSPLYQYRRDLEDSHVDDEIELNLRRRRGQFEHSSHSTYLYATRPAVQPHTTSDGFSMAAYMEWRRQRIALYARAEERNRLELAILREARVDRELAAERRRYLAAAADNRKSLRYKVRRWFGRKWWDFQREVRERSLAS